MTTDTTLDVYEARADDWQRHRGPQDAAEARRLALDAHDTGSPRPIVDLGCGPGWHTSELGPQAIALDAAQAMLDLVPAHAPGTHRVRADLRALPFRRAGVGGALASRCYVHLPRARVPSALADLHRSLAVGSPAHLVLFGGDAEHEPFPEDRFAGRLFSLWPGQLLRDVVSGAGFTIDSWTERPTRRGAPEFHIRVTRARTLPDTVGPDMTLLICGLNPSLYAADVGVGFVRPGNRFWPAALEAGLATQDRDPRRALVDHGVGMTDLVKRATRDAAGISTEEYRDGLDRVTRLTAWLRPAAVCFVGLTGWRRAVDRGAVAGEQPSHLAEVPVYVMPSTSGLNANHQLPDFVGHLRAARALAARSMERRRASRAASGPAGERADRGV